MFLQCKLKLNFKKTSTKGSAFHKCSRNLSIKYIIYSRYIFLDCFTGIVTDNLPVQESYLAELNNTGPLLPQRQKTTEERHFCGLHDTLEPVENFNIPEEEEERR